MDNDNIFFINMKKDAGRHEHIRTHVKRLNGQIWEGIDPTEIDKEGYAIKFPDKISGTNAAKMAKLKLFEYFLKNSKNEFLILFEDDIMFHKQFYNHLEEINDFLIKTKPKLLYFGVSSDVAATSEKFTIKKLIDKKELDINFIPHSGAYGVCINRNIIQFLILRIKNPTLKDKPFDMSCLGQIQRIYSNDCFITDPPMIIPYIKSSNIRENRNQNQLTKLIKINMNIYQQPLEYPLFVEIIDQDSFITFDKLIKCIIPIFRIYYVLDKEMYEQMQNIFNNHELIIKTGDLWIDQIKINNFMNKDKVIFTNTNFKFKYQESNNIYQMFGKIINNDICEDSRITIIKI